MLGGPIEAWISGTQLDVVFASPGSQRAAATHTLAASGSPSIASGCRIGTILGRRRNEVLAAGQGPVKVDRARLVLQKRTWNLLAENTPGQSRCRVLPATPGDD